MGSPQWGLALDEVVDAFDEPSSQHVASEECPVALLAPNDKFIIELVRERRDFLVLGGHKTTLASVTAQAIGDDFVDHGSNVAGAGRRAERPGASHDPAPTRTYDAPALGASDSSS